MVASIILWILVVLSIVLVGLVAFKVFLAAPANETNAERQTRLQSVFDLLKFLLGTVAVGVLTMALDQGIKQREEILKQREQAAKETEEFARLLPNVLNSDPEARTRFADFYATVTRDEDNRKLWVAYSQVVRSEIEKRDNKASEIAETSKKLALATGEEKKQLETQLSKQQQELATLKALLGSQAEPPTIQFLVSSTDQLKDIPKHLAFLFDSGYSVKPPIIDDRAKNASTNKVVVFNDVDDYTAATIARMVQTEFGLNEVQVALSDRTKPSGYFEVVLKPPSPTQ